MIKSQLISSGIKWPKLLILWAIHWNEKCWTRAIRKIIKNIKSWNISLVKWSINFIAICNPRAYRLNKRYFQENLNRVIKKKSITESYESNIANKIIEQIDNADYILDLHSIKSNWVPFVFQDYDEDGYEIFCKNIWLKNIVKWRPKLYEENDNSYTIWYAHKAWKIWAVVECGRHDDINSDIIAYDSILNTMIWLNIIDGEIQNKNNYNCVNVLKIINKKTKGRFVKNRNHLDKIYQWEQIAIYDNWEKVYADIDWFILLPNKSTGIWEEWFYIWK